MKQPTLFSLLAVLFLTSCSSIDKDVVSRVSSYQANDNLASSGPLDCVSIKELKPSQSPVDILLGVSSCIEQKQYAWAAELYLTAMSYGFYDTKRVADRTAHQAIRVLMMNMFAAHSTEETNSLRSELEKISSDNRLVCQRLIELGFPSYGPGYMIQHGMAAFTGESQADGIVEDFNAAEAWEDALGTVAGCELN